MLVVCSFLQLVGTRKIVVEIIKCLVLGRIATIGQHQNIYRLMEMQLSLQVRYVLIINHKSLCFITASTIALKVLVSVLCVL